MFSIFFYSLTLFTTGFDSKYGSSCVTLDEWADEFKILILIDTIQTIIIPFIFISVLNLSICYKMIQQFKQNKSLISNNSTKRTQPFHKLVKITTHKITSNNHAHPKNKEAITLLLIISVFLVLNFPITINKTISFFGKNSSINEDTNTIIRYDINDSNYSEFSLIYNNNNDSQKSANQSYIGSNPELRSNQVKEIFSKMASYIYYINYSINFFLYTFRTKQFRENIFKVFRK